MTDNKTTLPQPRRIHPIRKALKPVQDRIGHLNEAAVFLAARAPRESDCTALSEELTFKRGMLAETRVLFDAAVSELPEKYHRDSRLSDTRAAIERLANALDSIEAQLTTT